MLHHIPRKELIHAQITLFVAIGLQVLVWKMSNELSFGPQYLIVLTEIILAGLIGFTVNMQSAHKMGVHHVFAVILLGLITAANISSLILVLHSLMMGYIVSGTSLLTSAIAIFMTNIIVFALWYWEIDSPGLSRTRWSKSDQDFQFTQQEMKSQFPAWRPQFVDYLYVSLTNAINFAPADTRPLTNTAKILMGSQALVSIFTLALVIARAVNILGS